MPQHFKEKGYIAAGAGSACPPLLPFLHIPSELAYLAEIFHPLQPSGYVEVNGTVCRNGDDYPTSWSLPYQQGVDRAAGCVGRCKCMQQPPWAPPSCLTNAAAQATRTRGSRAR